jgi:hypothetical protein
LNEEEPLFTEIMIETLKIRSSGVWTEADWDRLEQRMHRVATAAASEAAAWEIIIRQARTVLRAYSTSSSSSPAFCRPANAPGSKPSTPPFVTRMRLWILSRLRRKSGQRGSTAGLRIMKPR